MTRVWQASEPREAADRLMLLALADNADDRGLCWPGIPTLARKCAVHRSTVIRTLERLEAAGHLDVERRAGRVNVYRITLASGRVDATGGASATGRADATGDVGDTGDADATGSAGATGTRRVDATPTRRVDATPPVAPARPEPSENRQLNPHNNHHTREAVVGGDGLPGVVAVGRVGTGRTSEAAEPDVVGDAAAPAGTGQAVDALVGRGVRPEVARRLASTFADRIDATLAAFDRSGQYGPGWLVRAVEADWATEKRSDTPPQGAYRSVPEPRRMQAQAVLWLEEHGYPASALAEHFEPAGTWEMDPDQAPVAMYRRRATSGKSDT